MTLRAHVEAIYESLLPYLEEHNAEEVQARLARDLRHLSPQWSDDFPDCPGWYWHKPPGIGEPQLLLVNHGRIDTKLMADLGPPNNYVDVQRIKGRWAGPLLPPG